MLEYVLEEVKMVDPNGMNEGFFSWLQAKDLVCLLQVVDTFEEEVGLYQNIVVSWQEKEYFPGYVPAEHDLQKL